MPMPVLLLSEEDVRQVLTMELALPAVEDCLRQLAREEAQNIPRARTQSERVTLHVLSAASRKLGALGYKSYTSSRQGAIFHVGLYDGNTGALLSLMQADWLGQVRTGAASGVATKYMARADAVEVGLYGTGKQARTQLMAVCKVRPVSRVRVYSPNAANRRRFAEEMSKLCETEVVPANYPEEAAKDQDIVITATSSREPVLNGNWLAEGVHLNVIGSNYLNKAEVDAVTVRRCQTIVVDSKDQARLEAGDFVQPLEDGTLHWSAIHELGQVIVGRYTGRAHPHDITMFKSLGIALEDVAVAQKVYEAARAQGVGRVVEW